MEGLDIEIAHGESLAGGGSTPTQSLPTKVVRIRCDRHSAAQLEQRLRRGASVSVIARVEEGAVVLDFRTVFAEQEAALAEALSAALR